VPTVYIPPFLQSLTGGESAVEVEGATVREALDNLEKVCPGIRARLLDQDRLRPNIRAAVDGRISPLGLLERVSPSSEIHFLAAISGGLNGK
jgi:molybdopterin synthase sulfur carrier subunit